MNDRRIFLRTLAGTGLATFLPFFKTLPGQKLLSAIAEKQLLSAGELSSDEDFWHLIRQAYTISPNVINLNNGGVSPQPRSVQEAVEHYGRLSNEAPSYYMWRILDAGREPLRMKLAEVAGCSAEELAINRNSSEALETVIFGLRLQRGDEVVLSKQDYPNMINAWRQREHRDGIVLKWLDFQFPIEDDSRILSAFEQAFSDQTKIVHVTHMVNWNGQVMPVRAIADAAHRRGIQVLCDGAHSFAHLDYQIPELGVDYFGTSLHKWLSAPFGTGLLWAKKEHISQLYPLFAAPEPESGDIRKFEHLGTRSFAIEQAIGHAVDFHQMIGSQRKYERLQFLKKYWTDQALELPGVSIGTSRLPGKSGAIALLQVAGMEPGEVAERLFAGFKIHTTTIVWENISGVRITPNVYTTTRDLDLLVTALKKIVLTR